MPKIYLSDKQLPKIPAEATLDALLELTKLATPGDRNIIDHNGSTAPTNFQLTTALGNMPLGRHDAELAAVCTPELVRGMLYKIALLEEARETACHLLQDHWGTKATPQQAAKLKKLLEAGNGELAV